MFGSGNTLAGQHKPRTVSTLQQASPCGRLSGTLAQLPQYYSRNNTRPAARVLLCSAAAGAGSRPPHGPPRGRGSPHPGRAAHQRPPEGKPRPSNDKVRELERTYGATDRTAPGYRSRQDRLDREMAQKEALYGSRFRDADVRLLILRREAAAAGQLRRRGGFAADDALPRPSTWHKLGGRIREQILQERVEALVEATARVGRLTPEAVREMYLAAPLLLTDITAGVAARLRRLVGVMGGTLQEAARAVSARPLLAELRVDLLEAVAGEVAAWSGLRLTATGRLLASEPSVATGPPSAVLQRCEALHSGLQLPTRQDALRALVRCPRLMAVEPAALQARATAALRLAREAQQGMQHGEERGGEKQGNARQGEEQGEKQQGEQQEAGQGAQLEQVVSGAKGAPEAVESLPWLLLCEERQAEDCLQLLQQQLLLPRPQAARLLLGQPALALQPQDSVLSAIRFLQRNLMADAGTAQFIADTSNTVAQPSPFPAAPTAAASTTAATGASGADQVPTKAHTGGSQDRKSGGSNGDGMLTAGGALQARQGKPPLRRSQQRWQQQQASTPLSQQRGQGLEAVANLAERYPHVLMLKPQRAAAALSALQETLEGALGPNPAPSTSTSGGGGLIGLAGPSAAAAAHMSTRAPQLLLCQLIPPGASVGPNAKDRNTSVMAKLKAQSESELKRSLHPMSVAADIPGWPQAPPPYRPPQPPQPPHTGISASSSSQAPPPAAATQPPPASFSSFPGVPVLDLGAREQEMLSLLCPSSLQPAHVGSTPSPLQPPGRQGPRGRDGYQQRQRQQQQQEEEDAMPGGTGGLSKGRAMLWSRVLLPYPQLLFVPTDQLASTVEALCAWLAVPPEDLLVVLYGEAGVPGGAAVQGSAGASSATAGAAAAAAAEATALSELEDVALMREKVLAALSLGGASDAAVAGTGEGTRGGAGGGTANVRLLLEGADRVQQAGSAVWMWLGGPDAVTQAALVALLRTVPLLLCYDVACRLWAKH